MSAIACVGFERVNVDKLLGNQSECELFEFPLIVYSKKHNPLSNVSLILIEHSQKKLDSLICIRNIKLLNPSIPIILVLNEYNPCVALQAFRARVWDVVFLPNERDYFRDKIVDIMSFRDVENSTQDRNIIFPFEQSYEKIIKRENDSKTKPAVEYIEKNYSKTLRIKDLSDRCIMTQSKFSKYFKIEQGCTARDYIKNYRMSVAKLLLKQTNSPVDKIAYESGFETIALFNRLFLKTVGYTPSQYRAVL